MNPRPLLFPLLLALGACSPQPSPSETVDSLVKDPERLKALRKDCKLQRKRLGDQLCDTVAEATRRRFLGDGVTPYTPASPAKKD